MACCGIDNANMSRKASLTSNSTVSQQQQSIRVYPNPANTTVYFEFPASEKITIKLFDVSGRATEQQVVYNNTTAVFNVASYMPGIYLYQVITNDKVQSGKILIGK